MHRAIRVSNETERGCGWRKVGGLYLVSDGPASGCGRFPIPLSVCPCCSAGVKPSRGWTGVNADALLSAAQPCPSPKSVCRRCPIGRAADGLFGRAGLIWIGESFYKTPDDFNTEAEMMGVSRRIPAVPREFVLGQTWVLLAHRHAIRTPVQDPSENPMTSWIGEPGIFRMFRPDRIEVIVTGHESDETIEDYLKRGLSPVKVERRGEIAQGELEGMR